MDKKKKNKTLTYVAYMRLISVERHRLKVKGCKKNISLKWKQTKAGKK